MGRYFDGEKQGSDSKQEIIKETIVEKEVDTAAIAAAVVEALSGKLGGIVGAGGVTGVSSKADTFDSKSTMKALAESMIEQRGGNDSNFENLGNVKETKKSKEETDSAIDFLANVDDREGVDDE